VANMQVAIWFWGKAGMDPGIPFPGCIIIINDLLNKIGLIVCIFTHALKII